MRSGLAVLLLISMATVWLPILVKAETATPSGEDDLLLAKGTADLPLGMSIVSELRSIIVEHREAVKEAILEFKVRLEGILENKTELVKRFIEERLARMAEIKERIRDLTERYSSGNITKEEFLLEMKALRDELKALEKSSKRLGDLLNELVSEIKGISKEKVEQLNEINRDFGKKVSEEARKIGEQMRGLREGRDHTGEPANQTSTHGLGNRPNNSERGAEDREHGRGGK